jgi:hypothetical protein
VIRRDLPNGFSALVAFRDVDWRQVPDRPGVYVIFDNDEVIYVGMAGRDRSGSLRKRLRDHSTGQVVNMFAQYLFLARVQFVGAERITHPSAAKVACRKYIVDRCSFCFREVENPKDARALEYSLKVALAPALNGAPVKTPENSSF